MSTAEASKYLGVTPSALYRLIDDGRLPAYRIGRVIRLKLSDVDEYVERSRINAGGPPYAPRVKKPRVKKPRVGGGSDVAPRGCDADRETGRS